MKSFIKNIAIPEFSSLVGKGFSRLLLVSFLFLIAIVASGIAESFDKILNEKMIIALYRYSFIYFFL